MLVIVNKKKFIKGIIIMIFLIAIVIIFVCGMISKNLNNKNKKENINEKVILSQENISNTNVIETVSKNKEKYNVIDEWNLKLVNKDNPVEKNYVPELSKIEGELKFDKRALPYLKNMINALHKNGIEKIWIQSAYRSYKLQEELFNDKVNYYKEKGKKQEEAETLAQKIVQRPEMSEHNLGLAVDFNTVKNEFEKTAAFKWLQKNAQDYGFVLRYPKDKQDITGINYESWHWRYVGEENAKVMKEKGYCLEEYIEYLKENTKV